MITIKKQFKKHILFKNLIFYLTILICICFVTNSVFAIRLKDLISIKGVRYNQLIGYGLVVGLNGTGDNKGTGFTTQSLSNMMKNMGIYVNKNKMKIKNVAAVIITSKLPPFARIGNKIDIVLSSVGDAKSLSGGTLLLTPLKGVNGQVYAIAQGAVAVGGYGASGDAGGGTTKNHPLVARIAGGATVEKEIDFALNDKHKLLFSLKNPDFTTACRLSDAINKKTGKNSAVTLDSSTIQVNIPASMHSKVPGFIASIELLEIQPDTIAKIIVNEKTGTIVVGENVRISTVAVSHGNLSITIKETVKVSQPEPFAKGSTVIVSDTKIDIDEENKKVILIPEGATIGHLVRALNAIGVTPRDLISIFQSIKALGALQADLEII